MRYVIIGNSAAGVAAAESIRSLDARGQITIIGHEPHHVYSRPLAAHLVAGELDEGAIRLRPADFYDRLDVQARLGVRAITAWVEKGRSTRPRSCWAPTSASPSHTR